MKFVAQYLREIPGKFPQKDGTMREWVDFQFLDLSQPSADGLEELIRYRSEKSDADDTRKKLQPGQAYEVVVNRLGWDKVPVIYRGRIGAAVKG